MTSDRTESPHTTGNGADDSEAEAVSLGCWRKFLKGLKDNLFMIIILVGVAAGFGLGFGLRAVTTSEVVIQWIELVGNLYIRVLDLTILPLISSNLIVVIAKINPKEQGKTSVIALLYIVGMNMLGASLGTAASAIIKPGIGVAPPSSGGNIDSDPRLEPSTSDVLADLIRNLFPDNIVGMCIQQSKTIKKEVNTTEGLKIVSEVGTVPSKNLIGILVVSIMFGLSARVCGEKGKPFLAFFQSVCDVVIKIVRVVLLLTPVGVCFMIAGAVLKVKDISGTFASIGMFVVTVTVGIALLFILTILIYLLATFRNPFKFLKYTIKSWFISFATTSPIVSLPEMFEGCDSFGMPSTISRFVCPVVCALKNDGPAVFISCACMFTTQISIGTVPVTTAVVIWLLTTVSVLAIPHIPSASIVITIIILNSANVSVTDTSYLFAIDWLLDRMRAGVSGLTTMYGAALVHGVEMRRSMKTTVDSIGKDVEDG